jgi:hypothetical protein
MPAWIHTAEAPACTGCYDHAVPAQFNHRLDPVPRGGRGRLDRLRRQADRHFGWACRMPSNSQITTNPYRGSSRQDGSGAAGAVALTAAAG